MGTYFNQQDEFLAEMISAYENNLLGKEYESYFAWKKVREKLDCLYEQEQADNTSLTYLEAMDAELTNIAMLIK